MSVSRILKIVTLVIALIGIYFFVKVATGEEASEALSGSVSASIGFTKILLIVVGAIIVAFMLLDVVKHPSKLKKTLIGLVAFVVLFVLSYIIASDGEVITNTMTVEAGSTLSKRVSTGITLAGVLGIIAFGGFVFDSVKTLFK